MHYAVLLLFCAPILFSSVTAAQPSTAPSSSLPVTPLSPATTGVGCDLCRSLEGRKGSDLKRHRLERDRDLHPHKNTPGVSHSQKRSLKSQLPHRKLGENEEEPQ
jgi:hypothetical protein